jgi:hypothetical protein
MLCGVLLVILFGKIQRASEVHFGDNGARESRAFSKRAMVVRAADSCSGEVKKMADR